MAADQYACNEKTIHRRIGRPDEARKGAGSAPTHLLSWGRSLGDGRHPYCQTNWGICLMKLAESKQDEAPEEAARLYKEALDKLERAAKLRGE